MHFEQLRLVQEWNGESRLSFELGDAMAEFGTAECCDVLLNIESSHHYPDRELFFQNSWRALSPNGYVVFADTLRNCDVHSHTLQDMVEMVRKTGFEVVVANDISSEVMSSLAYTERYKQLLIDKHLPWWMRWLKPLLEDLAGAQSGKAFKMLADGRDQYVQIVMKKLQPSGTHNPAPPEVAQA